MWLSKRKVGVLTQQYEQTLGFMVNNGEIKLITSSFQIFNCTASQDVSFVIFIVLNGFRWIAEPAGDSYF